MLKELEQAEKKFEQHIKEANADVLQGHKDKRYKVPIPEKALLTLEEAAAYTGIGQNKLRDISSEDDCSFVLWNGSKRLFKREKLVAFLYSMYSI